jgi:hypothetical protein
MGDTAGSNPGCGGAISGGYPASVAVFQVHSDP